MSTNSFTQAELAYLTGEPHLARLTTVGQDRMLHVAPVGWSYNPELGTIDIGGRDSARTKKFRDCPAMVGQPSWSMTRCHPGDPGH